MDLDWVVLEPSMEQHDQRLLLLLLHVEHDHRHESESRPSHAFHDSLMEHDRMVAFEA